MNKFYAIPVAMISSASRIIFRAQKYSVLSSICHSMKENTVPQNHLNFNVVCARFLNDSIEPIDAVKAAIKKDRTKTPPIPKITLVDSQDNIISVTTFVEAEKIALSRKLKLVKITDCDVRSKRAIYKLMTDAEYLQEDLKIKKALKEEKKKYRSTHIKGDKVILMSSKISDHDFELKLKKSLKWIENCYEVRLVISGSAENLTLQEEIYKKFEKAFQGKGKIMQKRIKNGDLKFQIQPPEPVTKDPSADTDLNQVPSTATNSVEIPPTATGANSIEGSEAVLKESSKV